METLRKVPPSITIETDEGPPAAINFKLPSTAAKAVGVWQDLLGTSTKQLEEFTTSIHNIHNNMLQHPLPRYLTWIALKQSIWKSIDYVLPATTLRQNLTLWQRNYTILFSLV